MGIKKEYGIISEVEKGHFYFKTLNYPYLGYNDCNCVCGLEVMNNIVIATELEDNAGTSITNMCEGLAKQVCKEFDIDPKNLIFIEYYPDSRLSYSRTMLQWDSRKKEFSKGKTTWRYMTDEQVKTIKNDFKEESED